MFSLDPSETDHGPFAHFTREQWAAVAPQAPLPLTPADLDQLASLGDPIDLAEVDAVYRPLSALLQLYVDASRRTALGRSTLLREPHLKPTPFIIGVAGSVAVGKSTVARLLRLLLSRWKRTPRVELITTDGFLLPNAELKKRGLMDRKGFPESYDRSKLLEFVARNVSAPVYSHVTYDIVKGESQYVHDPDILIVEGLNVLQPARTGPGVTGVGLADYFDFRIYVDAKEKDIETWYVNRFLQLRKTAFADPASYFRNYASLSDAQAEQKARTIWKSINEPNLLENIRPTRPRATLVLHKGEDHLVRDIFLRKI